MLFNYIRKLHLLLLTSFSSFYLELFTVAKKLHYVFQMPTFTLKLQKSCIYFLLFHLLLYTLKRTKNGVYKPFLAYIRHFKLVRHPGLEPGTT